MYMHGTRALAALGLALAAATLAAAEKTEYPTRPIRLVVPFAPGGSVDISSRIIAVPLSQFLGQQVVVDNRVGGGGSVGATLVAKGPTDGYTLLAGSSGSVTANPALYSNLPYDSMRDFAPISMVNVTPMAVIAHPNAGVSSLKDLVALAQKQPGKITMASAGTGSSNHLAIELFQMMSGAKVLHVPYKGSGAALTELVGGQVQTMIDQIASSIGYIRDGRLRILGVTSMTRSTVLPNVPTLDEQGLKGYEAASFTGILAPAGTPQPIVDRLYAAVVKAATLPAVTDRFKDLAADPKTTTPAQFGTFIKNDIAKWRKVAQGANIRLD
ncbi:MAG: tripartite tricarboxylate transporter substrate binding protein [Burkholderiales bacterium]|nr:tripartite tricarboxylate transporter substrate binding protein [Burkholderiales bacterium]